MQKKLIWIILASIFLFSGAKGKSYKIDSVDITAKINSDGSMLVTEFRNYNFHGNYSYAFREMPITDDVKFSNYRVSENGRDYRLNDSRNEGTYQVYNDNNSTIVKWHYRAKNEVRSFTFSYKVDGAITRYQDVAVLYYKFISEEWKKKNRNVNIRIIPPEEGNYGSIRHWFHGPVWSESKLEYNGEIVAWSKYIPARRFFEVRALYPENLFPNLETNFDYVEGKILSEESAWAEEANKLREAYQIKQKNRIKRHKFGKIVLPIFALLCLIIPILLHRKYGKRPPFVNKIDILAEAPENLPPAFVSYLINSRQILGSALVGTLYDLAVRKFLTLQEDKIQKKKKKFITIYTLKLNREYYTENVDLLQDFEQELIEFIFTEISDSHDSLDIKILTKKRSKFVSFFNKWKKSVEHSVREKNWFDRKSVKGANFCAIVGSFYLSLFIGSIFLFGPSCLYMLALVFITFIYAIIIPHKTMEGRWQYEQWRAFKRYLIKKKYKNSSQEDLLKNINNLFIYGIVFGITGKIYQDLAFTIPASHSQNYVYWYNFQGNQTGSFDPGSFSKSFSTMVTTTNAAFSSATGSGGGASTGGGGGASSGGGGAG